MSCSKSGDRRSSPRKTCAQCAWLIGARLRPGRDVQVVDLSSGGALVEAAARLLPGSPVVLHLVGASGPHTIRGRVLRCHVSALDRVTGVRYRAALAFDQSFRIPEDKSVARPAAADSLPVEAGTAACARADMTRTGTGS